MSVLTALKKADDCFGIEAGMLAAMCERINTPHALAVLIALREHDWPLLKSLEPISCGYIDKNLENVKCDEGDGKRRHILNLLPTGLPDVDTFRVDRQVSRLLVKSSAIPTGVDTTAEAKRLFAEIEEINGKSLEYLPLQQPWLLEFRYEINRILNSGDVDFLTPNTLNRIVERGRVGPGASAGMRSRVASDKIRGVSTVGPKLEPFTAAIKGSQWMAEQPKSVVVPFIQINAVPKTAWIDRTISAVPVLDMIVQRGLGDEIADRLKRFGCDIRDSGKNRALAKQAYEKSLATVDLSSASSWFTQRNMEPVFYEDFIHLLDLVRPSRWLDDSVLYDETLVGPPEVKELFNWLPMGCGHTFSVMSLYFWALVRIIVPPSALKDCSVFGDDIILPQAHAAELVSRLRILGFKVNSEKSFLNGGFFESCGTEWLYGHNVLPFYARRGKTGSSGEVNLPIPYRVQLANKLRQWAMKPNGDCDANFRSVWDALVKPVPPTYRPPVPYTLGDVGLWTPRSETRYELAREVSECGWDPVYRVKTLKCAPSTLTREDPFAYLLWLMQRTQSETVEEALVTALKGPDYFIKPPAWCYRWTDWLRSDVEDILNSASLEPPFTKGAEPVKGLFGEPSPMWLFTKWPDGLNWASRDDLARA
jgi:hypothetical protein